MEGFFLGESIPVNEKLSEIFLQLHISEKSGRGVPKIIETYVKGAFTFRENSIVVTIPLQRIKKAGNKVGKKVPLDKISILSENTEIIGSFSLIQRLCKMAFMIASLKALLSNSGVSERSTTRSLSSV